MTSSLFRVSGGEGPQEDGVTVVGVSQSGTLALIVELVMAAGQGPLAARALRALDNEAVIAGDRPHPAAELGAAARVGNAVVLAGRATRVP